jgi:hypothetical protein
VGRPSGRFFKWISLLMFSVTMNSFSWGFPLTINQSAAAD